MSELCGVLEALDEADSNKDEVVLATVVKAEGSGYRRPGARVVMPRLGQVRRQANRGLMKDRRMRGERCARSWNACL